MGIEAIQRYGGASLGSDCILLLELFLAGQRTMLDALIPAVEAFKVLELAKNSSAIGSSQSVSRCVCMLISLLWIASAPKCDLA